MVNDDILTNYNRGAIIGRESKAGQMGRAYRASLRYDTVDPV